MAHPRTLADWEALTGDEALSEAEKYLIECCREGELCVLGDGKRPDKPSLERNIRAELVRWLLLGGCEELSTTDMGVRLVGAFIFGSVDLQFSKLKGPVGLISCFVEDNIECQQCRIQALNLGGSRIGSLNLQGAVIEGDVFLRFGFESYGLVRLSGAHIRGQLACNGGRFINPDDNAILADRLVARGRVFLTEYFHAEGEVRFSGARINGQLVCNFANFSNPNGAAFNIQKTDVMSGFVWRNVTVSEGSIYFATAQVSDLVDDVKSWPEAGKFVLDGFTYERISASETSSQSRIDWLARGDTWNNTFCPQPYTQLAKVLREMGHDRDARMVLIEKEKKLAAEQVKQDRDRAKDLWHAKDQSIRGDIGWHWLRRTGFRLWNGISRRFVGYGYAPQYAFYWTVCILAAMTMFYFVLWKTGGMVPNTPVVLNSEAWAEALKTDPTAPGPVWAAGDVGRHYETFYAFFYAADVFIPLIDFGQESAWTGTTENWPGWIAFFSGFFFKAFGWFITALGAAAITGIIRRD